MSKIVRKGKKEVDKERKKVGLMKKRCRCQDSEEGKKRGG